MNRAFERYYGHFEPRRKIILQFLALARIVTGRRHFLRASLDIETAKLGDAGVAPGRVGQTLGVDPEISRVFDHVSQLVEAGAHRMGFVLPRRAGHLDKTLVTVMSDGGAHPQKSLAFEAAAYALHLSDNRRRAKALDPAARDLVSLPLRIGIDILHLMHASGDHPAHEAREGGGAGSIKDGAALPADSLIKANPFSPSVSLDEVNPVFLRRHVGVETL